MKIGIISDTHGFWDDKYATYLGECDEVWHAGDIGSMEVADRFEALGPRFSLFIQSCYRCFFTVYRCKQMTYKRSAK